jgi:hypothetical protein
LTGIPEIFSRAGIAAANMFMMGKAFLAGLQFLA